MGRSETVPPEGVDGRLRPSPRGGGDGQRPSSGRLWTDGLRPSGGGGGRWGRSETVPPEECGRTVSDRPSGWRDVGTVRDRPSGDPCGRRSPTVPTVAAVARVGTVRDRPSDDRLCGRTVSDCPASHPRGVGTVRDRPSGGRCPDSLPSEVAPARENVGTVRDRPSRKALWTDGLRPSKVAVVKVWTVRDGLWTGLRPWAPGGESVGTVRDRPSRDRPLADRSVWTDRPPSPSLREHVWDGQRPSLRVWTDGLRPSVVVRECGDGQRPSLRPSVDGQSPTVRTRVTALAECGDGQRPSLRNRGVRGHGRSPTVRSAVSGGGGDGQRPSVRGAGRLRPSRSETVPPEELWTDGLRPSEWQWRECGGRSETVPPKSRGRTVSDRPKWRWRECGDGQRPSRGVARRSTPAGNEQRGVPRASLPLRGATEPRPSSQTGAFTNATSNTVRMLAPAAIHASVALKIVHGAVFDAGGFRGTLCGLLPRRRGIGLPAQRQS